MAMNLPEFLTRGPLGEIRLTGHRIDLYLIVLSYNEGYTAEMLHDEYPTLPLALIESVLAFYRQNKAEVDAYVAGVVTEIEQRHANHEPGPGILRIRELMGERSFADGFPSEKSSRPS
jgi:uncharacterized protein (DUF433 family)